MGLLEFLLSPLTWLLLALLLGALAWRLRPHRLLPWGLCALAAVPALAMMTPAGANTVVGWLERAAPASDYCVNRPPPAVVVLAAGVDRRPINRSDFSVLNVASRRRMDRGISYWRSQSGRTLIVAGGPAQRGQPATADLLASYASWNGVPAGVVQVEGLSATTWESANELARLTHTRRIALVTSAMHMSRAIDAFTAFGFQVCPVPTDYRRVPFRLPWALLPRSSALEKSEQALHELVGIVWYRWLWSRRSQRAAGVGDQA